TAIAAGLDVNSAAGRDGVDPALDAAATGGDVDVIGDVGDQPASSGVEGVEDLVLDVIRRAKDRAVDLKHVAEGGDGVGAGVVDQLAGAIDIDGVVARVGRGAQVHRAAGNRDGRLAVAGAFLNGVGAEREAASGDQDGGGVGRVGKGGIQHDHVSRGDGQGGRAADERPVDEGERDLGRDAGYRILNGLTA